MVSYTSKHLKKFFYGLVGSGGALTLAFIFGFPSSNKEAPNREVIPASKSSKWDNDWDGWNNSHLKSGHVKVKRPKVSKHLILIRHGQYNLSGNQDKDRTLTQLGQEQAELTGQRLKELGFPYSRIIRSSMTRAVQTSAIIQKYLQNVSTDTTDLLREGVPMPPDPPVGHFRSEATYFQDGERIESAFKRYFHRADLKQENDSFEVYVCHANVIRYFLCRALQFPPEAWLRFSLHHCSITWITVRPSGRVNVLSVGDAGHLPPDKLTTS